MFGALYSHFIFFAYAYGKSGSAHHFFEYYGAFAVGSKVLPALRETFIENHAAAAGETYVDVFVVFQKIDFACNVFGAVDEVSVLSLELGERGFAHHAAGLDLGIDMKISAAHPGAEYGFPYDAGIDCFIVLEFLPFVKNCNVELHQ